MASSIIETILKSNLSLENPIYFLNILESDLQAVFDDLTVIEKPISVKRLLRTPENAAKGDFCMCLSPRLLEALGEKFYEKIKCIKYIFKVHPATQKVLHIHLNRPFIFSHVLNEVFKKKEEYGAIQPQPFCSAFVIVHNSSKKNHSLSRVSFVAKYLISFLSFNKIQVLNSGLEMTPELGLTKLSILCSDECGRNIDFISKALVNQSKRSKWRKPVQDKNDSILIDGGAFVKNRALASRFGPNVGMIKIFEPKSDIIEYSANTLHFLIDHHIDSSMLIHVSSSKNEHKIIQSECLNKVTEFSDLPEYLVSCQDIYFECPEQATLETYLETSKIEIYNAISKDNISEILMTEMLDTLLDTSLKFTFLTTRSKSAPRISFLSGENVKKNGGIFVQYNFARICKLLKTFELHVLKGYYKDLPEFEEIDFNLLEEPEEWSLLKCIMFYPRIIEEIYSSIFSRDGFHLNKIFLMLKNLSHLFSKYYRRIRILTVPELQLQKKMHARIWLLKGVYQIMYNSFRMINIRGLNSM